MKPSWMSPHRTCCKADLTCVLLCAPLVTDTHFSGGTGTQFFFLIFSELPEEATVSDTGLMTIQRFPPFELEGPVGQSQEAVEGSGSGVLGLEKQFK